MADRYVLELLGEQALLTRLSAAIQGLEHPRQLFVDIGGALEQNINIRFDTKRDPTGQAWQQISELTPIIWERINKKPLPGTLLERTRRMRQGLGSNASDQGAEVGFDQKHAIYHETGTQRNDKPYMPRRGLMFADPVAGTLSVDDQAEVIELIEDYVRGLLAG